MSVNENNSEMVSNLLNQYKEEKESETILRKVHILSKMNELRNISFEDVFIEEIEEEDVDVKKICISALGNLESINSVPFLLRELENDDEIAIAAAIALVKINSAESVEYIIQRAIISDKIFVKYCYYLLSIILLLDSSTIENAKSLISQIETEIYGEDAEIIRNPLEILEKDLEKFLLVSNNVIDFLDKNRGKIQNLNSIELFSIKKELEQQNQKNKQNYDKQEERIEKMESSISFIEGSKIYIGVIIVIIFTAIFAIFGSIIAILIKIT